MNLMVQRTPRGYIVLDETGKKLGGPYKRRETAMKQQAQVLYFKKKK